MVRGERGGCLDVQGDDVSVGLLHGDAQRVLAVVVSVRLRGAPLQEQTHLPGGYRGTTGHTHGTYTSTHAHIQPLFTRIHDMLTCTVAHRLYSKRRPSTHAHTPGEHFIIRCHNEGI